MNFSKVISKDQHLQNFYYVLGTVLDTPAKSLSRFKGLRVQDNQTCKQVNNKSVHQV